MQYSNPPSQKKTWKMIYSWVFVCLFEDVKISIFRINWKTANCNFYDKYESFLRCFNYLYHFRRSIFRGTGTFGHSGVPEMFYQYPNIKNMKSNVGALHPFPVKWPKRKWRFLISLKQEGGGLGMIRHFFKTWAAPGQNVIPGPRNSKNTF